MLDFDNLEPILRNFRDGWRDGAYAARKRALENWIKDNEKETALLRHNLAHMEAEA